MPNNSGAVCRVLFDQLGLELVPTNMPIEMLVVEKANLRWTNPQFQRVIGLFTLIFLGEHIETYGLDKDKKSNRMGNRAAAVAVGCSHAVSPTAQHRKLDDGFRRETRRGKPHRHAH